MRVLLVRLGALGDIVHSIPVAAALRRAHPSAKIDWLVSAKHREILDLVPIIDRRVVISDRAGKGGLSVLGALRELRRAKYDVTIDLQGLIKSALIARASGSGQVIGFTGRYLREPFARLFYTDAHDPGGEGIYGPSETRHVVSINLGLLEPLGIHAGRPEFPFEPTESAASRAVTEQTSGRFALLNPGAAWPNKRWPTSHFAGLAAALHERQGLRSAVLWGADERPLADDVVRGSRGAAILAPHTNIADVLALARAATVMVSGDTGPTHIASAVGTPIVGLYGPTRPERNGPLLDDDVTISRASVCQCHHLRHCRLQRMCLMDVSVDEVVAAVERRLAAGRARV